MGFGAKKSPFADLDSEFKTAIEGMTDEDIKKKVSEVSLNEHENRAAKKADQDLKQKQEAVKYAGAQYSEATKMNRLRIAYAYFLLEARGKV